MPRILENRRKDIERNISASYVNRLGKTKKELAYAIANNQLQEEGKLKKRG